MVGVANGVKEEVYCFFECCLVFDEQHVCVVTK